MHRTEVCSRTPARGARPGVCAGIAAPLLAWLTWGALVPALSLTASPRLALAAPARSVVDVCPHDPFDDDSDQSQSDTTEAPPDSSASKQDEKKDEKKDEKSGT